LHNTDLLVKELFAEICKEYSKRFNLKVTRKKKRIAVTGVPGKEGDDFVGATFESDSSILITVYDPSLDQEDDLLTNHRYVNWKFIEALCHEFVHAMQTLTGRVPTPTDLKPIGDDPEELYFFDPFELEARALEDYYAHRFGAKLREYSEG